MIRLSPPVRDAAVSAYRLCQRVGCASAAVPSAWVKLASGSVEPLPEPERNPLWL